MIDLSSPDSDLLSSTRVVILGLGLMGGSLALALKGQCGALYGADPDPAVVRLARERGVVEQASADPLDLLDGGGLIVLASPVGAILNTLENLPRRPTSSVVVLDLGSTKQAVMESMAALPDCYDPVGGHPFTGREKNGLVNATPDLFRGATFVLSALSRTSILARSLAMEVALAVGARPCWMNPVEHDRFAAATSHLPYLLACALAMATPTEASVLVGPGFRSTTRVASSSPQMMLDIFQTNQANVLDALQRFQGQLGWIEDLLQQGNWEALKALLEASAAAREAAINPNGEGKLTQ